MVTADFFWHVPCKFALRVRVLINNTRSVKLAPAFQNAKILIDVLESAWKVNKYHY